MAEVLHSFDEPIRDEYGVYHSRVVGRLAPDGMWEGWLEFVPIDGSGREVLTSPVESRQPQRTFLEYWATGLSPVYIEGALRRARRPLVVRRRVAETPASDRPAPAIVTAPLAVKPSAVLDPFQVGARNLDILAQELRALDRPRLLNIIAAYDLNPADEDIAWMSDLQLAHFIVVAVEVQLLERGR